MNPKLISPDKISNAIARWRLKSDTIVFSNGCFDVLHVGHLHTLQEAKRLGDKLVVGINSDASVKRLKGQDRPINGEQNRAELLSALSIVDAVVIFEEDSPIEVIRIIQPDVLVKGGDWPLDKIVGKDIVEARGGKVISVPFKVNDSSTEIINKIRKL
ncbi:MAG: D-glycero-beta-D-manno-heptose 1-phosphate adenylyltransferase [Chitinophagales bacterium]|nr:D-glycero-beta-D-manno-heptose 1-phosphate adenylyltransferase [Bacteroidota bacterium]MCB9257460.1 D-glycero-beta-D-manno-heptose 1-phosphate adenylyltransferase [Chitinophagales bacterium]